MDGIGEFLAEYGFSPSNYSRRVELKGSTASSLSFSPRGTGRFVVVAIASSLETSLDLSVKGPSGEVEASDTGPNNRCALEFIPREGQTYELLVESGYGEGEVLLQIFDAAQSTPSAPLAELFEADPVDRHGWQHFETIVSRMGYAAFMPAETLHVSAAERVSLPVTMKEGRCYMLGAVGGNGIDRVETRLQHAGGVLCRDLLERHHGWVSHCPERDMETVLTVFAKGGSGTLKVGFFDTERPREMPRLNWDGDAGESSMEELVEREQRALSRSGYHVCEQPRELRVAEGERAGFEVPIEAGKCFVVTAVASRQVRDLDLRLNSDSGREFSDSSLGPISRIPVCANPGESFEGTLIALAGSGKAAVLINELPAVQIKVAGDDPPLALREAAARFADAALSVRSEQPGLGWSDEEEAWTTSFDVDEGACYGLAVASTGSLLQSVEIDHIPGSSPRLWRGPGNVATLTLCPNESGSPRIEITTAGDHSPARSPAMLLFAVSPKSEVNE